MVAPTPGSDRALAAPATVPSRRVKPRWRGVPHLVATLLVVPAAAALVAAAPPGEAAVGAAVYAVSLALLFATSATYHVPMWPRRSREWLRRADHAAIFLLIAGSYTPICLIALDAEISGPLLTVIWAGAALGLLKSLLWRKPRRALNTVLYVALGWAVLPYMPEVYAAAGMRFFVLLAAGGLLYTIGAAIYARRWLNLAPALFGFHEVFHLLVIAAAACHFAAIWALVAG